MTAPLVPVVYYSLAETSSHWFIIYGFYHPRDWDDLPLQRWFEHENDFEGYLAIVQKPSESLRQSCPHGFLTGMVTVAHRHFHAYSHVLSSKDQEIKGTIHFSTVDALNGVSHPTSYQESRGHGCYAWDNKRIGRREKAIRYFPSSSAKDPETIQWDKHKIVNVPYILVDIFDPDQGFWSRRHGPRNEPFAKNGAFAGREGSKDAAKPPWLWKNSGDNKLLWGALARRPALLTDRYFSGHLPGFGEDDPGLNPYNDDGLPPPKGGIVDGCLALLQSVFRRKTDLTRLVEASLAGEQPWEVLTTLSQRAKRDHILRERFLGEVNTVLGTFKTRQPNADSDLLAPLVYLAGELRATELSEHIITIFKSPKHKFLQGVAANALANMMPNDVADLKSLVEERLLSPESDVRESTVMLYSSWYAKDDVEPLKLAAMDYNPNVRRNVARALKDTPSGEGKKILLAQLDDPQWDVRMAAAASLIEGYGKDGLTGVKERFGDAYNEAAQLVSGDRANITGISECFTTRDEYERVGLASTIAEGIQKNGEENDG